MSSIKKIIKILKQETKDFSPTLIEQIIKKYGKNPFLILICCLLSLRSKDIVTINVCHTLLKIAKTPQEILSLSQDELEKIIFKIGFHKNKAEVLHQVSHGILNRYNGKVPANRESLLKLPGVGQKTANLVLGVAYRVPSICVDIHVHRISNRLGLVGTKNPEETETTLKKIVPQNYWIEFNELLVKWGQNICTPTSPWCSKCAIKKFCKRIGVEKSR
ncbi:endonuclease III [Candidatus Dependentiae bacterium]|nr:endonuclease III [Candidatus Dependentiae bacterium]